MLTIAALFASPAAIAQINPVPEFQHVAVEADLRRCAAPACGGWWYQNLDGPTLCADGETRDWCYAATMDFTPLDLPDPVIDHVVEDAHDQLVFSTLLETIETPRGPLGVLSVVGLERKVEEGGAGGFFCSWC